MAKYKKCPYCKGKHRMKRAYEKCKRRHGKLESWPR